MLYDFASALSSALLLLSTIQLSSAFSGLQRRQSQADNSGKYQIPPGSIGFQHGNSTAAVTFDQHSFFLKDERIMLFSGEFHPWRQPSGPVLWRDVLQKMKAAGFSGVSIYLHWGITEGKQGKLDFGYYRSLTDFYEVAKSVGILVVVRPGPYINAETNAGGFPSWLSNVPARARTNDTLFTEAWTPWITEVAKYTAPYQYPDGPVIAVQSENEFFSGTGTTEHMILIEQVLRDNGITKVPLTHNDASPRGNFASGPGEVDLYGFDGYPLGFDCRNPTVWSNVITNYDTSHQAYSPAEPLYLPEFQGGAFDPWNGPGYDACYQLINEQFANVFYKNNYASGVTMQSLYMTYGGTNWGNLAEPTVYTSYDYGAPIREDRTLTPKYSELKLQAYFLHASPAFLTAVRIGNGTVGNGTPYSNNSQIFTTNLRDPETSTNFYFVRQVSNSGNGILPVDFSLQVNVSAGAITIPQYGGKITLDGRESKIIVTDYKFGSSFLAYSTAEIMTWTTIDKEDYLVLYSLKGQTIEVVLNVSGSPQVVGSNTISARSLNGTTIITGSPSGVSIVSIGGAKVIVADKHTALSFWNPRLSPSYIAGPAMSSVLLTGPYLVRNVSLSIDGTSLDIFGDTNQTSTTLDVIAPQSVKTIKWNGKTVSLTSTSLGTKRGTLGFQYNGLSQQIPSLKNLEWRCADSLPEIQKGFDDTTWITANKTSTSRPYLRLPGKYVLYADEYGYHQGNVIFRGHFRGVNATSVSLAVQGGLHFGYSAFINSQFLGSNQGDGIIDIVNDTFALSSSDLSDGDNVVTVIQDNTGLDEDYAALDTFKSPRGIRGYSLAGAEFDYWKVAGNYLGEDAPDTVRGPMNEGGLWAERVGALLPGFPDSQWSSSKTDNSCSPYVGIASAGVKAYRTSFNLDLPTGADIPIALNFTRTYGPGNSTSNYRSVISINGWQFGRFTNNFGPQTLFPLPEGILNHRGKNELFLTIWSLDANGAKIEDVELVPTAIVDSSKEFITGAVRSPSYSELRS